MEVNRTLVSQHGVEGYSGFNGTYVQPGWGELLLSYFDPTYAIDMTLLMLGLQFNTTMPNMTDGTIIQNYAIIEHPDMPGVQFTSTCEVEFYSWISYAENVTVKNFYGDDGSSAFKVENSGYYTYPNETYG